MPFAYTSGTSYTPWEREWDLAAPLLTQGNYLTSLRAPSGHHLLHQPYEITLLFTYYELSTPQRCPIPGLQIGYLISIGS